MKTLIIILVLIAIVIGIYLMNISNQQDATIRSVSNAEIDSISEEDLELPEGEKIILTKTSAGLTQAGAVNDSVQVDTDQTFITFTGYKVGGEHTGSFDTMRAELVVDNGSIKGGLLTIDATSVKTDTAAVDTHLQSDDFFDAENYPDITFLAQDIIINDAEQNALLKGSLTLKGVTKQLSVPVTLLANGIAVDFTVSMKEFGIEYKATKDEVRVQAQIVLK